LRRSQKNSQLKKDPRRKAWWVKDGHKTLEPQTSNYAGVVSCESARIAFSTYPAMMGLPVMEGNIKDASLQARTSKKHYIVCRSEFGLAHQGKKLITTGLIFGSWVAGRDYMIHLRECMNSIDSNGWYRQATKKDDGTEYMEYIPITCLPGPQPSLRI